jgi:hypothetical protein
MKFSCTVRALPDGRWLARYHARDVGPFEVTGPTRDEAVARLTAELRYRLELCPCTGESYQLLVVEVRDEP